MFVAYGLDLQFFYTQHSRIPFSATTAVQLNHRYGPLCNHSQDDAEEQPAKNQACLQGRRQADKGALSYQSSATTTFVIREV